jgi:hypothetical protein
VIGGRRKALLTTALAVLAGLVGLRAVAVDEASRVVRQGDPPYGGSISRAVADRVRPDSSGLSRLFATRRRAVLAHDRTAWLSSIDPRSTAFRARQEAIFDNLAEVPLADWTYQVLDDGSQAPADPAGSAAGPTRSVKVRTGYQVRGLDSVPSTTEQVFTVVRRSDRWLLADDGNRTSVEQPWDFGPVRVVRGDHVLVMGTARRSTLRHFTHLGDQAVTKVSSVWGTSWPRRAVLLVPRTQAEFGRLLRRSPDGLGQVAAVTTGDIGPSEQSPAGTTGAAGNDRIVLNPAAFGRLASLGQRVVITHEMTHVAVRQSTAGPVPIWLSEGFADYVAYLGSGVSRQVAAGDLLSLVRRGKGPQRLPEEADFDPTRTDIAPAYSGAWLACSLIAESEGQAVLVAVYRRAAGARAGYSAADPDPDQALASALLAEAHTDQSSFTRRWLVHLGDLAGAGPAR